MIFVDQSLADTSQYWILVSIPEGENWIDDGVVQDCGTSCLIGGFHLLGYLGHTRSRRNEFGCVLAFR